MKRLFKWAGGLSLVLLAVPPLLAAVQPSIERYLQTGSTTEAYNLDGSGNMRIAGWQVIGGSMSVAGATGFTGAVTNSAAVSNSAVTLVNYLPADQNGITQSSTIIPTASFMTLESTSNASTVVTLTNAPSIATATVNGGTTPWPNGTYLILGSTCIATARIVTLVDNATTAGTQLHLGAATRQIGPHKVLTLIYDSLNGFWNEVSYANNN